MIVFDAACLPVWIQPSDLRCIGRSLASLLQKKKSVRIGLRFVSLDQMKKLNSRFRGVHRPTDVLAFSAEQAGIPAKERRTLGDLVVCTAYARKGIKKKGIPLCEELMRLTIHGALHLFGFDHATSAEGKKMFALQEKCVRRCSFV